MGKIVKYCNACEEGFAEKFGYCPICGDLLKAFEMNPIEQTMETGDIKPVALEANETEIKPLETYPTETSFKSEQVSIPATSAFIYDQPEVSFTEPEIELDLVETGEKVTFDEPETVASASFAGNGSNNADYKTKVVFDDFLPTSVNKFDEEDDHYTVTVLTESNVKQRNVLLLGTMILMVSLCFGVVIASIFNHPLLVGAIGEDELGAFVPIVDEVPMTVEEERKRDNDKDAGGGGGGGRDEETPTSKGRLATQTENPLISPSKTIPQKDFELKQPLAATQGNKDIEQTEEPYGDPNSKYGVLSDGRGSGGGQGSGEGTGQGSGRGTGQGTGVGSGSGSGQGSGEGPGSGSGRNGGDSRPPEPRPQTPAGPSKGVNLISKPQPRYTDAARVNNIQGQVTLRITFLANGQIGSIASVKGLPHGLTEQAISAARQIRFEPAMKNGQPYSVTKSVQYTFTIY